MTAKEKHCRARGNARASKRVLDGVRTGNTGTYGFRWALQREHFAWTRLPEKARGCIADPSS